MKRWQFWLGIIISALFLYLALRGLRLQDVWGTLQGAKYVWLIPGVIVYFMGVGVRVYLREHRRGWCSLGVIGGLFVGRLGRGGTFRVR